MTKKIKFKFLSLRKKISTGFRPTLTICNKRCWLKYINRDNQIHYPFDFSYLNVGNLKKQKKIKYINTDNKDSSYCTTTKKLTPQEETIQILLHTKEHKLKQKQYQTKDRRPNRLIVWSTNRNTSGAIICATLGRVGYVKVPRMNQLKLKRATASDAGLFLIVKKNCTTLFKDMPTTANRATIRGMQESSASHTVTPTAIDIMALKIDREIATSRR